MTEYRELLIQIGGSTLDEVSSYRGKIRLHLVLKNGSEDLVLNLYNVFYLPNSPCNMISLGLLNDSIIFYNHENETLYPTRSKKTLALAQR